jgi:hypothetical protein
MPRSCQARSPARYSSEAYAKVLPGEEPCQVNGLGRSVPLYRNITLSTGLVHCVVQMFCAPTAA